jgi:hypothetical protein
MSGIETCGIDRVVGIGDPASLRGYALTGLVIRSAQTAEQICAAWDDLSTATELVLLTAAAAAVLHERMMEPTAPLTAVLPNEPTPMATEGPA